MFSPIFAQWMSTRLLTIGHWPNKEIENFRWCIEMIEKMLSLINKCLCVCVFLCVVLLPLCMLLLTLDWIGWTGLASSSGLVWLCSPVVCLALCTSALLVFGRHR